MALVFSQNISNIAGGSTWWYLKELLKTAGWIVKSSGDGLAAFSSSSDILSLPGTGANGMNNASAWFRIQMPTANGVTREFVFQRGAAGGGLVNIKYSYSAGFSGGAPSTTVIPTATDSQTIANSSATVWATDFTFHLNIGAQSSAPYGFWMAIIINGAPNTSNSGGMLFEPLLTGSYPPGEIDPYIIYVESNTSGSFNSGKIGGGLGLAWYGKGTATETFGTAYGCIWNAAATTLFPGGAGVNPYSLNEQIAPILWVKNTVNTGLITIKGIGSFMMWNGTQKQSGQLMSNSTVGDRICISDVNFPWNNIAALV